MNAYLTLKHVHVACVVLSGLGFCLRAYWMLANSPLLAARATRVVPHVVDSFLLASALGLALLSGQYPFINGWLTAKVCGLLAYIGCGTMALKRGRTRGGRIVFLVLAILIYAYIVSVALARSPAPYL